MIQALLQKSISLIPWRLRGAIKKIPLVASLQRLLIARFLEGREFIHTVDAGPARGLCYPISLPADKGIWTGTYELDLAEAIAGSVKPGDVCFDIGSWRGFFSGVMALAGASKVYAFEPLPENIAQLKKMIALNPALPISLIEAAVTDHLCTLEFLIMPQTSMGKLARSPFQVENTQGKSTFVRAVSLDALIAAGEAQPPSIIKIDVEGAELMVLRGSKKLLAEYKPKLFMEIHSPDLARDCRVFLELLDYEVRIMQEMGHDVCYFHAAVREPV